MGVSVQVRTEVAARRVRVAELRTAGAGFAEIAGLCGLVSEQAARVDWLRALASPAPVPPPVRCGTWPGYKRHLRAGVPACDPCMAAMRVQARRGRCSECATPVSTGRSSAAAPVCRVCRAARAARVCPGCGEWFRARVHHGRRQVFCSAACRYPNPRPRPYRNPPGWTRASGYGGEHDRLRAELLAGFIEGSACGQSFADGSLCGEPMSAAEDLDLGHTDDRAGYIGLVHASCNRRAAAQKRNGTTGRDTAARAADRAARRTELLAARAARAAFKASRAEAAAAQSAARHEQAGAAYALRLAGLRWQEIAGRLGFANPGSAYYAAATIGPLPDIAGRQGRRRRT